MATDIPIPWAEFDTIIWDYLQWIEDYLKRQELAVKNRAMSVAQTEEEKKKIQSYSEAFAYKLEVYQGRITFYRVPESSEDDSENVYIEETYQMAEDFLPEEVNISMGNAEEELGELFAPQIEEYASMVLTEKIGGEFS